VTDSRQQSGSAATAGPDWFANLVQAVFVVIGTILVFTFAWALLPAVQAQNQAACRALGPQERDDPATAFSVQDLAGNPVSLKDYRGKFVILNFWATWCEPCTQEWPELDQLAQRLGDRDDVVILAVSVDEEREAIDPFLKRMSLGETPVTVLWDPEAKLHMTYGSPQLPDTYFIDRAGQIQHVYVNVRDWGSPAAANCVEFMAAG
jgi:peroxiredoxin